jgi:hypothetical protein
MWSYTSGFSISVFHISIILGTNSMARLPFVGKKELSSSIAMDTDSSKGHIKIEYSSTISSNTVSLNRFLMLRTARRSSPWILLFSGSIPCIALFRKSFSIVMNSLQGTSNVIFSIFFFGMLSPIHMKHACKVRLSTIGFWNSSIRTCKTSEWSSIVSLYPHLRNLRKTKTCVSNYTKSHGEAPYEQKCVMHLLH